MRPLEEQTILITGSTDGLGKQTALVLAAGGATVLLHGRDEAKVEATLTEIVDRTGNDRVRAHVADLASLPQVRRLAAAVEKDEESLDVLVNNAGVGGIAERRISEDGYELNFAVNYLSGFQLTALLLALLRRSSPARIVNVASAGQHELDFDDVMLARSYDTARAYRQSKLAQILFTVELDERLRANGGDDVTVNALHPASLMDTKLVREWWGTPMTSLQQGVDALVHMISSPGLDGVSGRYFDGLEEARAHEQAYDPVARKRLWELSERLVQTQ